MRTEHRRLVMSVIAVVDIPADEFPMGQLLAEQPDLRLHLERVVPSGPSVIPYFWAPMEAIDGIEERLSDAADVESFVIDSLDGAVLVRAEWSADMDGWFPVLQGSDATILEAIGQADRWSMTLRFDDREDLTRFYRHGVEEGYSIEVREVHNAGRVPDWRRGVTDVQYETLVTALELGSFDVPRRRNLVDLAAELGISDTAASERLRRGRSALVRSALNDEGRAP